MNARYLDIHDCDKEKKYFTNFVPLCKFFSQNKTFFQYLFKKEKKTCKNLDSDLKKKLCDFQLCHFPTRRHNKNVHKDIEEI